MSHLIISYIRGWNFAHVESEAAVHDSETAQSETAILHKLIDEVFFRAAHHQEVCEVLMTDADIIIGINDRFKCFQSERDVPRYFGVPEYF